MVLAMRVTGLVALSVLTACAAVSETGESRAESWTETEGLRLSDSGYRATDDPCRRAGESAVTVDFLDDAADLVACPSGDASVPGLIDQYGASEVAQTESYTLFSVPRR